MNLFKKRRLPVICTVFLLLSAVACLLWDKFDIFDVDIPDSTLPRLAEQVESKSVSYDDGATLVWAEMQYKKLAECLAAAWGKDNIILPGPTRYVKYTNDYKTRASVDFENGEVTMETIDSRYPLLNLKEAIISTVLAPIEDGAVQLSSVEVQLSNDPVLYNQILTEKKQPMRSVGRASRFADQLLKSSLQTREVKINGEKKIIYSVCTHLVDDNLSQRTKKYLPLISRAAKKYGLSERLICAIAKTESYFNPFAISPASAYGIMQIVPSTAGAEVYELLTGKKGRPDREQLFNPAQNIEYGAAYLHILAHRYFNGINNQNSRKMCAIAAYNGGPSAVLKVFGPNKENAVKRINSLTHKEVYQRLVHELPSQETRRYLDKVIASLAIFSAGK